MVPIEELIAYENDELDLPDSIDMFARLIQSGMAWKLQGHYGRTAQALIDKGWITRAGEICFDKVDKDMGGEV